jgi:membrane peptidoglycan carboxypeptidase
MRNSPLGVSRALILLAGFVATSLVCGALTAGLLIPVIGGAGQLTLAGTDFFNSQPVNFVDQPAAEESTMYTSDGRVIAHFYDENRTNVPLSKISLNMQNAIIAIEDARFYQHGGVDPQGLLRAFVNNQTGGATQGASTLTQQYIKNVNVEKANAAGDKDAYERAIAQTPARKIEEAKTAVWLEQHYSKKQILEKYLNIALFGEATYGVEAAAERFFSTSAAKLTLGQAATLAGLVQSPSTYNPLVPANRKAATERRNQVLTRMRELDMISEKVYRNAVGSKLVTKPATSNNGCIAAGDRAYFCEYVRKLIEIDPRFNALGKTQQERRTAIRRGGLKIYTTMNANIQRYASKSVKDHIPPTDSSKLATAAVTVQPKSGRILAIAQNRIFDPRGGAGRTTLNFGVDKDYGDSSGFQTGSTFKPFTLAAWLTAGHSLYDTVESTVRSRAASEFTSCGKRLKGDDWFPKNSSEGEGGKPMSALDATVHSVNTAYAEMESKLDLCDIADLAGKMGVRMAAPRSFSENEKATTKLPTVVPSLTLGTMDISPMTMASAYGTFANDGTYCTPVAVQAIKDRNGKTLSVPKSTCSQALEPEVAKGVTYALKQVITRGTAVGNDIGRPAAGKTGTTDESKNTWFVGYTPQLSTAVWVSDPNSYDGEQRSLRNITIKGRTYGVIYGGTMAAPIWRQIMRKASQSLPSSGWNDPQGTVTHREDVEVPNVTGKKVNEAVRAIEDAGLKATVQGDRSGVVISTSPGPGSRLQPGDVVQIITMGSFVQPGDDDHNGDGQMTRPGWPNTGRRNG